ncbi:MAG TPA: V-type ATP synthase subunit K [Fervidicoccus fontis]|uniref:V-type ATP synthase subunit K n=2 Tax=Fervidicoccus fontis TaxID=683846 RepID=A0A7C2VAL7_9CREN|nr:ATP synthase subunit C [Fervidicoccus fontis]HEW64004.1 V-type ATP synthase subunit K [Fervidicoccus fontis]
MLELQGKSLNRLRLLLLFASILLISIIGTMAYAQTTTGSETAGYKAIGAGLAIGLAGIGGGIAVARTGAAGLSVLSEKPEAFGAVLLIVALGEGIAIYGLIIAILVIIL